MKEMYLNVCNINVYVKLINENYLSSLVWLHGWGCSCDVFKDVIESIKDKLLYKMVLIDLPGFGKTKMDKPLSINEYATILNEIIKTLRLTDIVIIAHSFGGRVAIEYSLNHNNCKKIFLISTKVEKKRGFLYHYKIISYKIKKKFLFLVNKNKYYKLIKTSGSFDYVNSDINQKKTLIKAVRYDLLKKLKKLKTQTVLMASIQDETVDYNESLRMYRNINNCVMYSFTKSNHYLFITEKDKFIRILDKELRDYK